MAECETIGLKFGHSANAEAFRLHVWVSHEASKRAAVLDRRTLMQERQHCCGEIEAQRQLMQFQLTKKMSDLAAEELRDIRFR